MRNSVKTTVFFLLLFASAIAGAANSDKWEVLGRSEVDFKNDHDRINVGRGEGRFKQLQLRVKNAPIEISDMVVTFQNDETFSPKMRHASKRGPASGPSTSPATAER